MSTYVRKAAIRLGLLVMFLVLVGCAASGSKTASGGSSDTVDINRRTDDSEERTRARVRLELAINYYRERSYSVALDELRKTIQIDPKFADAYGILALVYDELGERALTEESYQQALQLSPNDSYINNNYGWFLCKTGREAQSINYFNTALRNPLYETPAQPLQNAGLCYLRMNDLKNAEAYLLRSFELNPGSPIVTYNLATIFYKRAEYERAKFYVQRLLRLPEPGADMYWLAIRLDRKMGDRVSEAANAIQLRNRFPKSAEYAKYQSGAFDE